MYLIIEKTKLTGEDHIVLKGKVTAVACFGERTEAAAHTTAVEMPNATAKEHGDTFSLLMSPSARQLPRKGSSSFFTHQSAEGSTAPVDVAISSGSRKYCPESNFVFVEPPSATSNQRTSSIMSENGNNEDCDIVSLSKKQCQKYSYDRRGTTQSPDASINLQSASAKGKIRTSSQSSISSSSQSIMSEDSGELWKRKKMVKTTLKQRKNGKVKKFKKSKQLLTCSQSEIRKEGRVPKKLIITKGENCIPLWKYVIKRIKQFFQKNWK
jgi:hypothetical protein